MTDLAPPGADAELLRDAAARLVADHGGLPGLRRALQAPAETRPANWDRFAALGWLGAVLEEPEGPGLPLADLGPLLETLAAGLVPDPYIAVAVATAATLGALPGCGTLRAGLADGTALPLLAHPPAEAPGTEPARARPVGTGWTVDGRVPVLPGAAAADALLLPAAGPDGAILLRLGPADAGLVPFRLLDGTPAGALHMAGAPAELLAAGPEAHAAAAAGLAAGRAAGMADAVGAMEAALGATRAWVAERQQFGRPIGAFQVIQHGLADMFAAVQEARSMALLALRLAGAPPTPRRDRLMAAARVKVSDAARLVAHRAIQYHGGMGVSDETEVAHLCRRLLAVDTLHGPRAAALAAYQAA